MKIQHKMFSLLCIYTSDRSGGCPRGEGHRGLLRCKIRCWKMLWNMGYEDLSGGGGVEIIW